MPNVPAWRIGLATAAAETGDAARATEELDAVCANNFDALPRDLNYLGSMMMIALATHNIADASLARAVYRELEPFAGRLAVHGIGYASYGAVDLALGQTAEAAGDVERALRHYNAAIDLLDPRGSPYAAVARLHLATMIFGSDPVLATKLAEAAAVGFETTGLSVRATRARALVEKIATLQTIVLRETSKGWTLQRGDRDLVPLPALKGFRALRELVTHPGGELHALDLTAAIEGHPTSRRSDELGEAVIDESARSAYGDRLVELGRQLDAADESGDFERSVELSEEVDAITAHLKSARGLGGRTRRSTTNADRARVNVTKHIKRAIDRIADADPDLGSHLQRSVTTGMTCAYRPVDSGVSWSTAPD